MVVTALNNPATIGNNLASVFPNPTSSDLLVKFKEVPHSTLDIQLMSSSGQTVQFAKTKEKLITIPTGNLPAGNYFIKITGNNYAQTEGVIISK